MLEAQRNEGVHSLIHHPLMSVFWRKCFTGQNDVPWTLWWEAFPEELRRVQAVPLEVGCAGYGQGRNGASNLPMLQAAKRAGLHKMQAMLLEVGYGEDKGMTFAFLSGASGRASRAVQSAVSVGAGG